MQNVRLFPEQLFEVDRNAASLSGCLLNNTGLCLQDLTFNEGCFCQTIRDQILCLMSIGYIFSVIVISLLIERKISRYEK